MQVLPPENCSILYDSNLRAIVSVFTTEELCDNAIKQLILDDFRDIKRMIEESIINGSYDDNDASTLQLINWAMDDGKHRILSTYVTYRGYSPSTRYRKYVKELNDFDLKYKNNTRIIILPKSSELSL
jgi:hypothetical protein